MGYKNGNLIAYLRVFFKNEIRNKIIIGRVVTKVSYRGKGIGKELMKIGIKNIYKYIGKKDIYISAQEHLIKFYSSLNFSCLGETYLEDGIPHISMVLRIDK